MNIKKTEIKISLLPVYNLKTSEVFKKMGEKAAITDYAMLLGGKTSKKKFVNDKNNLKKRVGLWRLFYNKAVYDRKFFHPYISHTSKRGGYRPIIPVELIKEQGINGKINDKGIFEIEFGEYPQYVAPAHLQEILENNFKTNQINKTGKIYTIDKNSVYNELYYFEPYKIEEYELEGEKYIRLINFEPGSDTLSTGEKIHLKRPYWIKVEPIKWYIDEKQNFAITENILFAGINYAENNHYIDYGVNYYGEEDFSKTTIYKYLNTYFINEILPKKDLTLTLMK